MSTTQYELPLSREDLASLPDSELIKVGIQSYFVVIGDKEIVPEAGYVAERIVDQTGLPWGAAILVAMSEPRR